MNSKTDVTSHRFILLSDNDEENPVGLLDHKVGDRFVFTQDTINGTPILDHFPEKPVIEIIDIKLSSEGKLCYEGKIIHPQRGNWAYWEVEDAFLKTHWRKVDYLRILNIDYE